MFLRTAVIFLGTWCLLTSAIPSNVFVVHSSEGLVGNDVTTTPTAEQPLAATLTTVDSDWASFYVTGNSLLFGKPVASIKVNYNPDSSIRRAHGNQVEVRASSERARQLDPNTFAQTIRVDNLKPGNSYEFSFQAVNSDGQLGPVSTKLQVILLPEAPDVEIRHAGDSKIVLSWGSEASGHEDYYQISYEKTSSPGCNVSLSVSTCFGNQYSFDDLERHTTYTFTIRSHNPSGYSKAALIEYPID
jgi:hypothetical protein